MENLGKTYKLLVETAKAIHKNGVTVVYVNSKEWKGVLETYLKDKGLSVKVELVKAQDLKAPF